VLQPIAPGVWWIAGAAGDADASNHGAISNLLVVRDGRRTWALGSGPSPIYGRLLDAAVRRTSGRPITDVIAPWTRPELVLGAAGLRSARRWAHAEVAAGMRERCPGCIERLARRLGDAAGDLGTDGAPLPDHLLTGPSGRLGPWHWWRLQRSTGSSHNSGADEPQHRVAQTVTLWHLDRAGLWLAPGLLWNDGAPDLRDSTLTDLLAATATLRALADSQAQGTAAQAGRNAIWLGEQGPPASVELIDRHLDYWRKLEAAARLAWDQGVSETSPAPPLDGVAAAWLASPRHALNWQRAWREVEARALAEPGPDRAR
jgi:hypothetical protein